MPKYFPPATPVSSQRIVSCFARNSSVLHSCQLVTKEKALKVAQWNLHTAVILELLVVD
jgi:hypothetical protein